VRRRRSRHSGGGGASDPQADDAIGMGEWKEKAKGSYRAGSGRHLRSKIGFT
jgi:hypothetical protein